MGSPGFVWTDEPHDPTSFTLVLRRAVAERQRWRAQYDQGQNRGRCCGQCFCNGESPTRRTKIMKMYMTIEEVAQSLRVTVPTVRWLRQEGRFAPAIKVGRRVLWDEEALTAWLEANREAPAR
jgi:excisionase family DNA binding protein